MPPPCALRCRSRTDLRCVGGRRLTAFKVLHTVPAVGYALEGPAGTFAFSGDTTANDDLWNYLNSLPRLDKLMIDKTGYDAAQAITDLQLAQIAIEASAQVINSLRGTSLLELLR